MTLRPTYGDAAHQRLQPNAVLKRTTTNFSRRMLVVHRSLGQSRGGAYNLVERTATQEVHVRYPPAVGNELPTTSALEPTDCICAATLELSSIQAPAQPT